jgi:hypothetical protein
VAKHLLALRNQGKLPLKGEIASRAQQQSIACVVFVTLAAGVALAARRGF